LLRHYRKYAGDKWWLYDYFRISQLEIREASAVKKPKYAYLEKKEEL